LRGILATEFGLTVPIGELAGHTVASLTLEPAAEPPAPTAIAPHPAHRYEPFDLTPLQHAYLVGRAGGYPLSGVGTHFYAEFDVRISRPHRVHVSLDLLVLDLWSMHILSREWRQLYEAPDCELPPLTLTFRDYVVQAGRLADDEVAKHYWLDRLDTLPGGPEL